jgi:hypothetical protein
MQRKTDRSETDHYPSGAAEHTGVSNTRIHGDADARSAEDQLVLALAELELSRCQLDMVTKQRDTLQANNIEWFKYCQDMVEESRNKVVESNTEADELVSRLAKSFRYIHRLRKDLIGAGKYIDSPKSELARKDLGEADVGLSGNHGAGAGSVGGDHATLPGAEEDERDTASPPSSAESGSISLGSPSRRSSRDAHVPAS